MNEIKLKENFYQYQFAPTDQNVLGQNLYVLYGKEECIIFDAGYERHMTELIPKLKSYKIKFVICTHFHPDHCFGLNVLPKQYVIGSTHSMETLKMFEEEDNELLVPEVLVVKPMMIRFEKHTIKLSLNPGHSKCNMLINIDDEFLLIGDDYMTTNQGKPVLPYIAYTLDAHIKSIQYIIDKYKGYQLLPSHGMITNDIDKLVYRIKYLEFAKSSDKDLSNFYTKEDIPFLNERWHSINIRRDK